MQYANISTQNEIVDVSRYRVISLSNEKVYRLIPSRFPPVDIYAELAPPEDWPSIFACESRTNPRLRRINSNEYEALPGQNWNQAPFAYPKPKGSTFSRPHDVGYEVFATKEGALAVSVLKRSAFLAECEHPPTEVITRLLVSTISGTFIDLTKDGPLEMTSEHVQFGERCRITDGIQGIAFVHNSYPYGLGYSVFDQKSLGATVQGSHFAYVWNGREVVSIRDSSRTNDPRENSIDIESLFAGNCVLAA